MNGTSKDLTDRTVKSTRTCKKQYVDDSSAEQNTDASVGKITPSQTPTKIEQNFQSQVAMRRLLARRARIKRPRAQL